MKNENEIKTLWFLTDRWFRVIEFAIILGVLGYLKTQTTSILIHFVYWVTWGIVFIFCRFTSEYLLEQILGKKLNKYKLLNLALSFLVTMILYLIVNKVGLDLAKQSS